MATEARLNTTLHRSHDLEWSEHSLPHQSILTVLKFFGVSEEWCLFFQRFLRAPLRYDKVYTQLRGTPVGYALSTVLSLAWAGSVGPTGLPTGDIRCGFLRFDPSEARFIIDQKEIDFHITELRRQLASTKSVFGWVNAYNKYMAFMRNFGGRPAPCFGKAHVTDIIDTISRIQKELFPDIQGGAVEYLRSVIGTRFGIKDLPQGHFYLPISSGGLELRHPMLETFASMPRAQGFENLVKSDERRYGTRSLKSNGMTGTTERRKKLAEVETTPLAESFLPQSKTKWHALD
ncbi:hypothetical protein C0995_010240 [Termitomyces sp. Mi166|nr:hypothetical protein C0995_010240 [Termitomyces sp. Mi166\